MHGSLGAAALLSAVTAVNAATHQLIVGTFGPKFLYTLEFDDEALTLELVANTSVPGPNSWLSFNHDKTALYGTNYGGNGWVSYAVPEATSITHTATVAAGGNCTGSPIFQVADHNPPYAVYGGFFSGIAGCGAVISVDDSGTLVETIQNFTYASTSGVHGSVLSPDSQYLYSADDTGDRLWVHRLDRTTGAVSYVAEVASPSVGADPRHVAIHPAGTYLYVLLEGSGEVALYSIDAATGVPAYTNVSYSLVTDSTAGIWADEVALSPSGRYLWATNRGRPGKGTISVFTLAADGAIEKQNFLFNTSTSGGAANAVTPSLFSDRFVALTDSELGFVEIWELSEGADSAAAIARVDIVEAGVTDEKGCCANAVWYS